MSISVLEWASGICESFFHSLKVLFLFFIPLTFCVLPSWQFLLPLYLFFSVNLNCVQQHEPKGPGQQMPTYVSPIKLNMHVIIMHAACEIIKQIKYVCHHHVVFIKGTYNNIFEVLTFKIINMKCVCYLYCCGLLMYNDMYNKAMRFFFFK